MKILIKNGMIVSDSETYQADILIEDEKVKDLEQICQRQM